MSDRSHMIATGARTFLAAATLLVTRCLTLAYRHQHAGLGAEFVDMFLFWSLYARGQESCMLELCREDDKGKRRIREVHR